jgi:hypothetical protein
MAGHQQLIGAFVAHYYDAWRNMVLWLVWLLPLQLAGAAQQLCLNAALSA